VRVAAWRAARSGLSGGLVDPVHGTTAPAADVVAGLLAHVRPALEASGDLEWVTSHVKEVFARGNGAIQQRRWREDGADDSALVARAVEATLA
jgi:carboxylate-amine ligase